MITIKKSLKRIKSPRKKRKRNGDVVILWIVTILSLVTRRRSKRPKRSRRTKALIKIKTLIEIIKIMIVIKIKRSRSKTARPQVLLAKKSLLTPMSQSRMIIKKMRSPNTPNSTRIRMSPKKIRLNPLRHH